MQTYSLDGSTFYIVVVMTCSAVSDGGVVHNSTGRILFMAMAQVPLNYGVFIASSAQVPATLQLIYSSTSTTGDHALPCFPSPLVCRTDLLLVSSDILLMQLLSSQILFAQILLSQILSSCVTAN